MGRGDVLEGGGGDVVGGVEGGGDRVGGVGGGEGEGEDGEDGEDGEEREEGEKRVEEKVHVEVVS